MKFGLALLAVLLPLSALADSAEIVPGKPFTLALQGPASVPLSLELKPGTADLPAKLFVDIWMDGKALKRVSLPPARLGETKLQVPPGRHVFEFRADPASKVAIIGWTSPGIVAGPVVAAADDPLGRSVASVEATSSPAVSRTKGAEQLSRAYTPVVGEMLASDLFQVLVGIRPIDSFTTVSYDRQSRTLVLSIFGTENSVDRAKRAIEELRAKAIEPLIYRAEVTHGVKLEDADFTIRYLNRSQDYREVVRREAARYVIGD